MNTKIVSIHAVQISWPIAAAFVLLLGARASLAACDSLQPTGGYTSAALKTVTFTGADKLPWSNSKWTEKRAKYYTPTITIDKALPVDIKLKVWVKEDKTADADDHLGTSWVRFKAGQTTGEFYTNNDDEAQERGFPARTQGKFWLVATKERKPKGNVGKGDDDHAKVFMDVRYENNSVIVDKHGYVIGPWNTCDVGGHQSGRKTIRVDNK
jgi:hypothetical protein